MISRTDMARSALSAALRTRAAARLKPWEAIDIFDLAQTLGIEVRFARIASMEGMYAKYESPVILVAAERPPGRQRFTCAHELGHHTFGHGSRIDELLEADTPNMKKPNEELLADMSSAQSSRSGLMHRVPPDPNSRYSHDVY